MAIDWQASRKGDKGGVWLNSSTAENLSLTPQHIRRQKGRRITGSQRVVNPKAWARKQGKRLSPTLTPFPTPKGIHRPPGSLRRYRLENRMLSSQSPCIKALAVWTHYSASLDPGRGELETLVEIFEKGSLPLIHLHTYRTLRPSSHPPSSSFQGQPSIDRL